MVKYIRVSNCGIAITLGVSDFLVEQITQKFKEFYDYHVMDSFSNNDWLITSEKLINQSDQQIFEITQHYKHLDEPIRKFLVDKERKILQVLEPIDMKWLPQILTRLTRDALRNLAYHKMHYLHGAFVVYKDYGVCILGEKRGGKTTSILNILSSDESAFISNDDVSVAYNDGTWEAFGWPRSISVRKDSISALEKIGMTFDWDVKLNHPYNMNNVSNEYVTFYPNDFSKFTRSPILKNHRLDVVLFTSFAEENKFLVVDEKIGEERLNKCILHDINDYFGDLGQFFLEENIGKQPIGGKGIRYFEIQQDFSNLMSISKLLDDNL